MTTLPTNDAAHESLTESKPRAAAGAPDRIFLTPRVLDAAAFAEYAESLQSLIRDLDERSARLSGASTDSDRIAASLREASSQLKQRAQAGASIAKRLDSQIAAADRALGSLKNGFGDEQTIARLAEEAIVSRQSAIDKAIAQRFASLESRLREAESRAEQAEARAAATEKRLATLTRSLETLETQAGTIETRTTESIAGAESRAERATTKALDALEQLRVLADDIRAKTGADTREIEARLGPARDLLADAATLLGSPGTPGVLHEAIANARAATSELKTLHDSTGKRIAAAAEAHATIVDTVKAAAESIESLRTRTGELIDGLEGEVDALSEQLSPVERAAASLGGTLDELAQRTHAIHREIQQAVSAAHAAEQADPAELAAASVDRARRAADEITSQALRQVEEAAEWLSALAAQAHPPQPVRTSEG